VAKSRDTKESRERREYRRQQEETDIASKEAAARSAELEAMRKRTEELRVASRRTRADPPRFFHMTNQGTQKNGHLFGSLSQMPDLLPPHANILFRTRDEMTKQACLPASPISLKRAS
jgi:hypothetical protein